MRRITTLLFFVNKNCLSTLSLLFHEKLRTNFKITLYYRETIETDTEHLSASKVSVDR